MSTNVQTQSRALATALNSAQAFVRQAVLDCFGRHPTDTELSDWTTQVLSGSSRSSVARAIMHRAESIEKITIHYAKRMFRGSLDGPRWNAWMVRLGSLATIEARICAISNSLEYWKLANENSRIFIINLFRDLLETSPSRDLQEAWTGLLTSGSIDRESLCKELMNSTEFQVTYVTNVFRDLLNRNPNRHDLDYWLSELHERGCLVTFRSWILSTREYLTRALWHQNRR